MKTMKDLALSAIAVQDACNLSGVIYSFSIIISDLREIARAEGWECTEKINQHPVSILYSDKIASLTGCRNDPSYAEAHDWATDLVSQVG
jgi:hypothetical protein